MIHQKQFSAMGCQMLAALDCWAFGGVGQVLESVPEWFEEWEAVLSRFRPESELCLLNLSPEVSLPVSETLCRALQIELTHRQVLGHQTRRKPIDIRTAAMLLRHEIQPLIDAARCLK